MVDIQSFVKAHTVAEAVRVLAANPGALLISGGTDVLVKLRDGQHAGCTLVSLCGIAGLSGVQRLQNGTLVIGAATCFTQLAENELVQKLLPGLALAASQVGGPQIRNTGTIGGNVCNGAVSADTAPSLLALNAVLAFTGADGDTEIPIQNFYTGPGQTVRAHTQVLTAIKINQADYQNFGSHYIKFGQRGAMEIATTGCAAHVRLNEEKTAIAELRIAFGVAAPTPIRCPLAEQAAVGLPLTAETQGLVAAQVLKEVAPRSSWRASRAFRLQLIKTLSQRALAQAVASAGGKMDA